MTLREMFGRIAAWWRRDELSAELAEEMEAHAELLARDLEHDGMPPAEALAAARRRLGNVTGLRERSRDAWGFPSFDRLGQDVRYALRGLRRTPGFTAAAVLTLAMGIGANAAMFGVIDRLMLRPFPYMRDPGTVNRVYLETTSRGRTITTTTFPYTRYLDLARETSRLAEHAAVSEWRFGVGGEDAQVQKVAGVSASFFRFFDAPPVLGRYFSAAEDSVPMGALVAVVSHAYWRDELGSADVLGRELKVGQLTYTVIGVAPDAFVGTVSSSAPAVFVPITTIPANLGAWATADYHTAYNWDWAEMLVRRAPGVSERDASFDLGNAFVRSRAAARAINPRVLADSLARPRAIAGPVKTAAGPDAGLESRVLLWVVGVAGIVLLIACASVANLMLARVIRRTKETTLRLALGVSRRRLAAQFLTESLLLASLGAVAGLAVAQWSGVAIRRLLLPEGSPLNLADDWRTMGVAFACMLVCAVLTALGPVFVATRSDLTSMLKSGGRDGSRRRSPVQSALLIFQVSLSAVLLIGAALFVHSFQNARAVPLGYDAGRVLEVIADFRGRELGDDANPIAHRRLLDDARALPGVEYATLVNSRLFRTTTAELRVPGIDSVSALGRFNQQVVSTDYFLVMGTRILRGRPLEESDRAGTPFVAVVSEAMARALWPGRDPVGECMYVSRDPLTSLETVPCTTIVGIAENSAQHDLATDPRFMYYLPAEQFDGARMSTMLLRMTGATAASQVERVRWELTRVVPGDGFVVVRPLQEIVDNSRRSWRLGATLFVAFGGLAFLVAIVGLYGVISYDVAGRMHELGVLVALGAQPGAVVRLVVGGGVRLGLAGVVFGVLIALGASRWVQPLLFRQSATDLMTYTAVGGTILVVALAASLVPAFRASRADPVVVLRAE